MRKRKEFDSLDDFVDYLDAVNRFNNNVRPKPRPVPETEGRIGGPVEATRVDWPSRVDGPADTSGISRKVGIRLTPDDHELLQQLAAEHSVAPSTMARILVVKGVRAAYSPREDE